MKYFLCTLVIALTIWSCSKQNSEPELESVAETATPDSVVTRIEKPKIPSVQNLKFGMSPDTVRAMMGEPTKTETIPTNPKVEVWWYGENQKVSFTFGKVDRVTIDVAKEQTLLKQIVDASARGDEKEVNRLMEELTGK